MGIYYNNNIPTGMYGGDELNTKEEILNTSFRMFMERGYTDVSLIDILKEVGITKGALYHYFSSKESLFEEVLSLFVINPLEEFVEYINGVEGDMTAFLSTLFKTYVYMIDELIKLIGDTKKVYGYYLLIFSAKNIIEGYEEKLAAIYGSLTKAVENRSRLALSRGEGRADIDPYTYSGYIIAICEGIFTLWILDRSRDYKELYEAALKNVIKDWERK